MTVGTGGKRRLALAVGLALAGCSSHRSDRRPAASGPPRPPAGATGVAHAPNPVRVTVGVDSTLRDRPADYVRIAIRSLED
jgi:hypothetical protein